MRIITLYIFLLCLMVTQLSFSQEAKAQFLEDRVSESKITNETVAAVQNLFYQHEFEKALKQGLEAELFELQLNKADSFHLFQTIASAFAKLDASGSAFQYAKKAFIISSRSEILSKIHEPAWISPFYTSLNMHDSAVFFYQKSVKLAFLREDTLTLMGLYNNIGYTHYLNKKNDSAIYYYEKIMSLNVSDSEEYAINVGLAAGNLALVYVDKKEYEKAISNSKIDARLSKLINRNSYINAMNSMAFCYYKLNEYEESKKVLLALTQLEDRVFTSKIYTLRLLAKVYHELNYNDSGYYYMEKHVILEDSVQKQKRASERVLEQLSDFKVRNVQKDLEIAKKKEKIEKIKNRIYSIVLVFTIIIILLSVVYFKTRQKKKAQINKLKYELLSLELNNRKKDLSNVVTNLNYKRKFISTTQEKLKVFKQQPKEELLPNLSKLIREFENYKIADKSLEVFQSDFEKVNLTFFKTLSEKFPLLTENEKEVCGLIVLKLSSKDIASIRNVTPNAVKKARQNIRKKLPITSDQSLSFFLESI
jgi:DNA-binding CsgD family transcriptional regulator/tetratricopeptide (TPR) repeat protein